MEIPQDNAGTSPELIYLNRESGKKVLELCRKLKKPYDAIAVMYFCEEMTAQEIADKQQKNLKTVQTQIYRAKAMMKKMIGRSV